MDAKVLLIDDDDSLTRLEEMVLREAGYRVQSARNGIEGLRRLYEWRPDLVILDVMMPKMDGWETCRRIREVSDVPVIMLTAKAGEPNELQGLEGGADLYMAKPFQMSLLLARIRALLRRSRLPATPAERTVVTVGGLRIDLDRHEVTRDGLPLELSPTEFKRRAALAAAPGRVVPREELLSKVWGQQYASEDLYLKLYIRYLRQKLEDDPSAPAHIITKRGVGYYLNDAPAPFTP